MIGFGLSPYRSSEERRKSDFAALDRTFKRASYSSQEENEDDLEDMDYEKTGTGTKNNNYGSGWNDVINSSEEELFDKVSKESHHRGPTKVDISSTLQQENKESNKFTSFVPPGTQAVQNNDQRPV